MKPLTAFYDLDHSPVSYDVVTWLIRALMEAQGSRLHCVIVPKENGFAGFARRWGGHDEYETRWRLWHIVVPVMQLAGATVTLADSREQALLLKTGRYWWPEGKAYSARPIIEASRAGKTIPRLQASIQARRVAAARIAAYGRPVVTMTLRQMTRDPDRNTDPAAWRDAAETIEHWGYRVIEIRDTSELLKTGFCDYLSLDVDLRLAVYESAVLNLIGNNGPAGLLWYSRAPFAYVCAAGPGPTWRAHWDSAIGLKPEDQLPWAAPDQRLIYRPDTTETLLAAFENWRATPC